MRSWRCGLLVVVAWVGTSQATYAGLVLGTFPNDTWVNSASSTTVTLPIIWNGSTDNLITSFGIALKFAGGTAGSLAISNPQFPTINPIFSSFSTATPTVSSPATGVTSLNGENASFSDVAVPVSPGKNAVVFTITSPSQNAQGTFQVYADKAFSSYFTTTNFDGSPFANASASDFLLGTITIPAAVPEPASLLLASLATLGMAAHARRRRRRHADVITA